MIEYKKGWAVSGALLCLLYLICGDQTPEAVQEGDPRLSTATEERPPMNDVTAHLDTLGNPFLDRYPGGDQTYARNVWDMQVYDGRLYLGHGNSSNKGPAPNAGPIDVWSYDPEAGHFAKEFTVDEEQIDRYKLIDGHLYIPGHDPRDDWQKGNFYRLEADGWKKHRTIPGGIHTYDLAQYDGQLFAALGAKERKLLAVSPDDGQTWTTYALERGYRQHTLFEIDRRLYAAGVRSSAWGSKKYPVVYEWQDGVWAPVAFPGLTDIKWGESYGMIVRPVPFGENLIYLVATNVNDHQWTPQALYAARSIDAVGEVVLPGGGHPWDILVRDGVCYVLVSKRRQPGLYDVVVWASREGQMWSEVLRFDSDTFARSFEELGGDFYFGLGCETDALVPSTGMIIRVRGEHARTP